MLRCARSTNVRTDVRGEVSTGAGANRHVERYRCGQRPHGVRLGLLLPGNRQNPLVDTGFDQAGGDDSRRTAHRAGSVNTQQRLSVGAQSIRHGEFGHHRTLEQVGGLSDDDGVDVVPADVGVEHRGVDGFTNQARHRDIVTLCDVVEFGRCRARPRVEAFPAISSVPPRLLPGSAAAQGRLLHGPERDSPGRRRLPWRRGRFVPDHRRTVGCR